MKRVGLACVAVVAAVAVVYRHAPAGYFFEDDFQWLVGRWGFHPSHLLQLERFDHFYRPVIELYFWAGLWLFGRSAPLFHLANVVLHAANALWLLMLARTVSGSLRYGFVAALTFAVMPAYVEAIGWVSALAEPLAAFFGMPAIYCWIRCRRSGRPLWHLAAALLFALALLTHESSVVFLALLGLADLAFADAWPSMQTRRGWMRLVRDYLPFVAIAAVYLAINLTVNSRHYLVEDGLYRLGPHVVTNIFSYIASLYVGERGVGWYALTALVVGLLLVRGTPRVRFATAWMLLGILPFAFFTWDNISRYQYLPAIGFGLLLADGIEWVDGVLRRRIDDRARLALVSLVTAIVVIRFMVFASDAVANFTARTEMWRDLGASIRRDNPGLSRGGHIVLDRDLAERHGFLYLEALARWEFRDPTLRVTLR
jgi:hypothetical protein